MKTLTIISSSVLFGALAIGCGEDGILLAEILATSGNANPPPNEPTEPPGSNPVPQDPPPEVERAEVEEILLSHCGGCHSQGVDSGGLGNIEDIDALIARGLIVPGNPDESAIYVRIETGTMPPAFIDDEVSDEELARLRAFIAQLLTLEETVLSDTLVRLCGDCHTDDPVNASGGLSNIGDIDRLITLGQIVPGDRRDSLIYQRMDNGDMPPAFVRDNRPTPEDIEAVGAAIDAL